MSGRQAWSSSGLRASATPRRIQARPRGGSCQPSSQRSIQSPDGVPCDSHCSCGFLGVVATLLSVPDGDWTTAHSTREAHREELHRVRSRGLLARKHGASRSVSRLDALDADSLCTHQCWRHMNIFTAASWLGSIRYDSTRSNLLSMYHSLPGLRLCEVHDPHVPGTC